MSSKKETRGRKPVLEMNKKSMLRIYIENWIIDANGGKQQCELDWSGHLASTAFKKEAKKNKKF